MDKLEKFMYWFLIFCFWFISHIIYLIWAKHFEKVKIEKVKIEKELKEFVHTQQEKEYSFKFCLQKIIASNWQDAQLDWFVLREDWQRMYRKLKVASSRVQSQQWAYWCILPNVAEWYCSNVSVKDNYIYLWESFYKTWHREWILRNKSCENDWINANLQHFIEQEANPQNKF